MSLFLKSRNEDLVEWMDRPDCDRELLNNTYEQFHIINRLLSGWNLIYKKYIKPELAKKGGKSSILDIGCGGGDIIKLLHNLCMNDGFDVRFLGIDPDQRSVEYLQQLEWPDSVRFRAVSSNTLTEEGLKFDIVISNHLVHHLSRDQLKSVCKDAESLSNRLVIFNDIERSMFGYVSFSSIAPLLFRNSYIVKDGKISIKRSYRKNELQEALPRGWTVSRKFPFRLLGMHRKENR
jgi:2-polyprenyl-3-methyl-5-hydroxy-6-metoxy-1,4-benzoquinol methylase